MSRRYLDVEDVLNAIGDGNDSDTGGVGSEDDSDGDDDYEPNSISTLQTGEAEEELSTGMTMMSCHFNSSLGQFSHLKDEKKIPINTHGEKGPTMLQTQLLLVIY